MNKNNVSGKIEAFTLIELLVVISIIAILASLALPAIGGALQAGKRAKAINGIRQIGLAVMQNATETNGEIETFGKDSDGTAHAIRFAQIIAGEEWPNYKFANAAATLRGITDAGLPPGDQVWGGPSQLGKENAISWSWAINNQFAFKSGYCRHNLAEYFSYGSVLYAVSGSWSFNASHAADQARCIDPSDLSNRQGPMYAYGDNDRVPGVFLDGHAEMLTFPIDPDMINPPD